MYRAFEATKFVASTKFVAYYPEFTSPPPAKILKIIRNIFIIKKGRI